MVTRLSFHSRLVKRLNMSQTNRHSYFQSGNNFQKCKQTMGLTNLVLSTLLNTLNHCQYSKLYLHTPKQTIIHKFIFGNAYSKLDLTPPRGYFTTNSFGWLTQLNYRIQISLVYILSYGYALLFVDIARQGDRYLNTNPHGRLIAQYDENCFSDRFI